MNFFNTIGNPQKIVAPMVDHSGLAYRMLCRKYGADLVYTQMFHARMFVESEEYRKNNFQTCLNDRPLIVQFCGNDPQILLQAAKLVEDSCDAVDINLGCPQGIAKRGRYGAFLMEELDLLSNIVRTMSQGLKIPVTCKTRIYKDFDRTIRLCETLSNAGASLLTIHGRTREEKKQLIAEADWNTLRRIKLHYADKGIPIISNGGIGTIGDFYSCLEFTGVDGVMVSEAILEDPAFFSRPIPSNAYTNEMKYPLIDTPSNYVPHPVVTLESPTQYELAMEYLHFCHLYPPSQHRTIRSHLMKFLYRYFSKHPEFRNRLGDANTLADYEIICQELGVVLSQHDDREYTDIWYTRHQREKVEEETKSPTKTDKLKFESFFERLMNENNNKEENGCDGECDDGLFSGTGMFNTLVEDVNITESDSKI